MATLDSSINTPPAAAPITSIQPGGGWCFGIERWWGRLRRAYLRRFRPNYVLLMEELRQGECPDCPHDVIDPRDLKLVRNVCGYRWGEGDQLRRDGGGFAQWGHAELLVFSGISLLLAVLFGSLSYFVHPFFVVALAAVLGWWAFLLSFFRDPRRAIPEDPDVLVSPADGTVTHVEEVDDPAFPEGKAFRVSIFLSVFNVHVNRIPRAGRVAGVAYYPGEYLDARSEGCAVRNEQLWVDLEDAQTGGLVRIKQIAGAIARRIVCVLCPGEAVRAGDRFGMIKFGSRTDVLVPPALVREVSVRIGDKVRGGSTVLMRLGRS